LWENKDGFSHRSLKPSVHLSKAGLLLSFKHNILYSYRIGPPHLGNAKEGPILSGGCFWSVSRVARQVLRSSGQEAQHAAGGEEAEVADATKPFVGSRSQETRRRL